MAQARLEDEWDRTADILALLANAHRDHKKRPRPFSRGDFHPYRREQARGRADIQMDKSTLKAIKGLFTRTEGPQGGRRAKPK